MPTKTFPTVAAIAWLKGLVLPEIDRLEMNQLLADLEQVQRLAKGWSRPKHGQAAGLQRRTLRAHEGRGCGQGMTMATVDKLAGALGLTLSVSVQQLPRRTPRGRKPKKGRIAMPSTMMDWKVFARWCAEDAHENHFPSRRGTWVFKDVDAVVLYN